jgi:hypothetical protein
MSSQQHRIEKLAAKRAAGKRAIVKVSGAPYAFVLVRWGGASPTICLMPPEGLGDRPICHTAAEWKKLGAKL